MGIKVSVEKVEPRLLAAVRREVNVGEVGKAWREPLDLVWACVREEPGLYRQGHNVFLYENPKVMGSQIVCEFGVEVTREFESRGEVHSVRTPAGEAAVAVHSGPYERMRETHREVWKWMKANGRESAGYSWEIYGDPKPRPEDTETTIIYLLQNDVRRQALEASSSYDVLLSGSEAGSPDVGEVSGAGFDGGIGDCGGGGDCCGGI